MNDAMMAGLGGVLIGSAAVLLMFNHGRIFGISGIVSGAVVANKGDRAWRLLIIAGMLTPPIILALFGKPSVAIEITSNSLLLILAGLLVGVGTVIGGGCTSGHGVCGISRFSIRSLSATVIFMAVAGVTVYIMRHGA
ncbi:MAG: putative membrane protein YedE/YeeE [Saprospiraceae bacterium]|jgi:uncharacterized membrane protein YedE/YeeE